MEKKLQQNKKYLCKICNNVLKIKNELLFCDVCNIFIGKPETYQSLSDYNALRGHITYKTNQDKNEKNFSVMISVYLFFVITIGVGLVLYIGFSSGFLLGEIMCQNLRCI